jgi:excisionase family DNA binding protein
MRKRRPQLTDDLLNIHETAALLGRSVSTVYAWLERGLIPEPIKFGGTYRWRQSDLIAWAEGGFPQREPAEKETKAKA